MTELTYTEENTCTTTLTTDILNERYCIIPSIEQELLDKYKENTKRRIVVNTKISTDKFTITVNPSINKLFLTFTQNDNVVILQLFIKTNVILECVEGLIFSFLENCLDYLHNLAKSQVEKGII